MQGISAHAWKYCPASDVSSPLRALLRRTMLKHPIRAYMRPETWALKPGPSTFAPTSRWSNKDMDPVEPKDRTWSSFNYVAYWISDATNSAVWELASSMLAVGLSWSVRVLVLHNHDVYRRNLYNPGDRLCLQLLLPIPSLQPSWF